MSNWSTIFSNHKILEKLDQTVALFPQIVLPEDLPVAHRENYLRLVKATTAFKERFRAIDPDLLSNDIIQNVGPQISGLHGNVNHYAQNKNFGHIDNANAHLDNAINYSRAITATPLPSDVQAITATAASFQESVAAGLAEARRSVAGLKVSVGNQQAAVDATNAKLAETNKTIEQQKARLDQAISAIQQQTAQAEAKRGTDFAATTARINELSLAQTKDIEARFAAEATERAKLHDEEIRLITEFDKEHLDFLEKRRKEVDEIFGAIGSASLSGHFERSANSDAKTANLLRWIALGLMGAMIAIGVYTYAHSITHPEVDWKIFAFRLATTIIVAVPAVYAAQESSKHRERERKNRTLQLELASIDAYLALLPQGKQHELKEKLTEHFFGRAEPLEKKDEATTHALLDILKTAVGNLTKPK